MTIAEMIVELASAATEVGEGAEVVMQYDTPNWFSVKEVVGPGILGDKPMILFDLGSNLVGGEL